MSNCCRNTTWRARRVSVIEASPLRLRMLVACSTAVAAFSAVSRAATRARLASKPKYAFLHSKYHALLLAVELQVGGKQGLGRAVEIRCAPAEIQQQPIQPQQ